MKDVFDCVISIYLFTYSMERSLSWETNRCSAGQEIPRILWKSKVHYRSHKCPLPIHIFSQLDPVHTPTSHFLVLSSHLRVGLPSDLFPSSFPLKNPIYASPLLIRSTFPAHLILLDFITRTILGEGYRSLSSSLCSFSPCYLVPLRPKYFPQLPILKHPQPTYLPQCERPSFTPIQNKRQNYSSVFPNLYIFG